jgi:hypothetical protein
MYSAEKVLYEPRIGGSLSNGRFQDDADQTGLRFGVDPLPVMMLALAFPIREANETIVGSNCAIDRSRSEICKVTHLHRCLSNAID